MGTVPWKQARYQVAAAMMDFEKSGGLITAVVQDHQTGEVLMVAHMNAEAFELTCNTRKMHYFSRSRNKLWLKGESSGHFQTVHDISIDCDRDAAVFKIEQIDRKSTRLNSSHV